MALILTLLTALPIGYLARTRGPAVIAYVAAWLAVFTFQTAGLLLDWAGGDVTAFGGPFPAHDAAQYVGYGIVNAVILTVGVGLVMLGVTVRRRTSRTRVEMVP